MKRCKKCGEVKPFDQFYKAKGMRDGYRSECKTCHLAQHRIWYSQNREASIANVKRWQQENKEHLHAYRKEYRQRRRIEEREAYLRRTFGITQADYEAILEMQRGGCAICGKEPGKISLHVDHDHESGEVRGLLCVGCNNALGQFHDDLQLLARASDYLVGADTAVAERVELTALAIVRAGELREAAV
jgi:hypothetical protein